MLVCMCRMLTITTYCKWASLRHSRVVKCISSTLWTALLISSSCSTHILLACEVRTFTHSLQIIFCDRLNLVLPSHSRNSSIWNTHHRRLPRHNQPRTHLILLHHQPQGATTNLRNEHTQRLTSQSTITRRIKNHPVWKPSWIITKIPKQTPIECI